MKGKTIYQELKENDIEIDHHESDLYFPVTDKTEEIMRKHDHLWRYRFISNKDNKAWFLVPFVFDPFWEKRGK